MLPISHQSRRLKGQRCWDMCILLDDKRGTAVISSVRFIVLSK